jgi:transcriptional regulator
MHNPPTFQQHSVEAMHGLMRTYPLALLVTHGPDGLQASPIPFLLYADEGEYGTLRAHMARANPHWKELGDVDECLVVFRGPDGYVTPSWYASKVATQKVVPTWNYAIVHARGKPLAIDDAAWLARQLNDLTSFHEAPRPQPWSIGDAPGDYIAAQMKAIVGIEIPIARLEGKWKMSQNKDEADRRGVLRGMRAVDDAHENQAVADVLERTLAQ